jgi:origin recognition complex subunit 1
LVERAKTSLLLSVVPELAPCRTEQEESILVHVTERIRGDASELLYLSGQPGTGKTLTVHRVLARVLALRDAGSLPPFKYVSINALNDLPGASSLFDRLHADVTGQRLTANKAQRALETGWYSGERPAPHYVVLLLDELDSLNGGAVLHTLLEWMSRPRSRLLIIGISNTIDLLERLDTKTLSRGGMAVRKVLFRPYSWEDILQILESRLASCGGGGGGSALFDRQALELCAKKTANDKGDVRRALQVCLRALEKHEDTLSAGGAHVSALAMAECLKDLRTGSFATALGNLSLFEKLFMWALARESAVTGGPGPFAFAALETRLSVELEQIRHATLLACPGRHVWEQVRDALLSSHLLLLVPPLGLLACPKEFQPEDITFYMKRNLREDDVLKHLPRIGNSFD